MHILKDKEALLKSLLECEKKINYIKFSWKI